MRRLLVIMLAVATLDGAVAGCSPDAPKPLVATGYALEGSAMASDITRDSNYLRTIGVAGVTLAAPDEITPVSKDAAALRRSAQNNNRRAMLLVSNFNPAIDAFDEDLANQMLTSPDNRRAVVAALVASTARFDGLQIEFQALATRDSEGLLSLTEELRDALPASTSLSMGFIPSTDLGGYRERGYDLKALGEVVDRAVLMAYEQHGPTSSDPGPIASLPWVRRELAYFASQVDREKVDLGVAAYGHQWDGAPDTLTVEQARTVAGSAATWSAKDGEWHADLAGGKTIWWSDVRSVRRREKLATELGVHGVAIWQIGSSAALR